MSETIIHFLIILKHIRTGENKRNIACILKLSMEFHLEGRLAILCKTRSRVINTKLKEIEDGPQS